ncbi:MAG: flagellar hook protein FlgE [Acidobacteriaceae bacterium]|jgi:flagellar hook protein FlgE
MPSFSIALTGLEANGVALDTIGNNLANLNTTAFKDQTTTFSDLFYQNIGNTGSGDALQVGLGTQVAGTSTDFSQGSLSTTTSSTDMALNGNGFFVLNQGGLQQLTRAGNFQLDQSGNLITTTGDGVMGYVATNGVVNTNTPLEALQVPVDATQAAQATANFGITANLDAATAVGGAFSSTITMYDSLGQSHAATINFTNTAANTWNYAITLPPGDATGTPVNNTGTLTFNSSGQLLTPAANVTGIKFPGLTDAAADMNLSWDLYGANGVAQIGQTVGTSTVTASQQDGFASGSYQSFSVDSAGVISAAFSNGQTQNIGQIAVASVTNTEGLTIDGGNNYQTSASSGAASIGAAGAGGRATIEDDTLEQSNVDISTEFANLIVAQRAFEANSKTVTTFDTVTQETINMIR